MAKGQHKQSKMGDFIVSAASGGQKQTQPLNSTHSQGTNVKTFVHSHPLLLHVRTGLHGSLLSLQAHYPCLALHALAVTLQKDIVVVVIIPHNTGDKSP